MTQKITGAAFLSLDGVMQAPGGPTEDPTGGFGEGGWMFKIWDPGIEPTLGSLFSGDHDLLLGRGRSSGNGCVDRYRQRTNLIRWPRIMR